MANHAVTVALAASLQETQLRNLPYGDLDSVGLFQQRPSQGWGTVAQIMDPNYAAAAFYDHLAQVSGWQTMAVTEAAQLVQHSAAPNAYASWEAEARSLASALPAKTGWEVAAWGVAHAYNYHLSSVSFDGWKWTVSSGRWALVTPPGRGAAGSIVTAT
jgi:hypothetical protein